MGIIIKEVLTKSDLKKFIKFPFALFKDNTYWVPPLNREEMQTLSKETNPAFEYCEARYWLAFEGKNVVGRVAAIINSRANTKWNYKRLRFGWLDFIDNKEVSKALFAEVEKWAASKGMETIDGPMGFTDMDNEGMLVEGFDKEPTISNIYNYPYYLEHMDALGYVKRDDWLQFKFNASQPVPDKVERLNKLVLERYNLRIGRFKTAKEVLPYGHQFFQTLNKAFANLYGFVELTDKEIDQYVKSYLTYIRPELICLVFDPDDNIVAFGVSMPTLSAAYKKANGKLFPFGFLHLMKALKKNDAIDLYLNGVHPDWQKRGIASVYYAEMNKTAIKLGIKVAISNQQLESNKDAIAMWKSYESEPYIRRRCYTKELLQGPL